MKTVRFGDKGTSVSYLQQRLTDLGYDVGKIDGIFGNMTLGGVEQFQMAEDLVVDGIVGRNTWGALTAGLAVPPSMMNLEKQQLIDMISWADGTDDLGTQAIKVAVSYLGCKEIPNGSNGGKEIAALVDGYNGFWGIRGSKQYAWCAMAVSSWIGMSLGLGSKSADMKWTLHPFGSFLGGVSQIENWAKENNVWHPNAASASDGESAPEIRCGSIFTMGRGGSGSDPSSSLRAGHTGLVVAVHDNGTITTIEGNTSNRVKSKVRKISKLRGFVSWWDMA